MILKYLTKKTLIHTTAITLMASTGVGFIDFAYAKNSYSGTEDTRMAAFQSDVPGSIWNMMPFSTSQKVTASDGSTFELHSLNPNVNSWFILDIVSANGKKAFYHLENSDPLAWDVSLELQDGEPILLLEGGDEGSVTCTPWDGEIETARGSSLPYAPICDWALSVRNTVRGNKTTREAVSDFLRDNVVFGDSIVNLIKGAFYQDAFMVTSEAVIGSSDASAGSPLEPANLKSTPTLRPNVKFDMIGAEDGIKAGNWYEIENASGIYYSVMQPQMIADEIFSVPGANGLDNTEKYADVYSFAFDMSRFDIGYSVGTDHPQLGWSSRPTHRHNAAGPDGFNRPDPLVRNGTLNPKKLSRIAAAFTGGFKREHGAWRFGNLATYNYGNHYGFIQDGVILSRLWPDLATLYVDTDGNVNMETWRSEFNDRLSTIAFARQNGVPLIENGKPTQLVTSWGLGNWSGSADANLRTLRSGICSKTHLGRQYLVYSYFSSGTPSAMARVFQAYGCDYAMISDMNSQELTYGAIYLKEDDTIIAKHLVAGMALSDVTANDGSPIPRFVMAPDNRDFFYLTRRE